MEVKYACERGKGASGRKVNESESLHLYPNPTLILAWLLMSYPPLKHVSLGG